MYIKDRYLCHHTNTGEVTLKCSCFTNNFSQLLFNFRTEQKIITQNVLM